MNVGTLMIEIVANLARLQADMTAVKRSVQGAMKEVEQYVGVAKTAFIALTGVAGVNTFAGLIDSAIQVKAQLYDLGLKTGITVEALGGLSKVALLSGADIQTVAAAHAKLSKALETTNEDSAGAAQGLKALGIEFKTFRALSADQQLLAVAKAMEGFADGAGKTAAAMLLFGKSGADILPFLKELSERGVMASTQTTAMAKAAKDFQDNLILLKGAGETWATSLADRVLPPLVELTTQMLEAKTAAERWQAIWGNIKGNLGVGEVPEATFALKALNQEIANTQHHIDQLTEARAKGTLNAYGAATLDAEIAQLKRLSTEAAVASEKLKSLVGPSDKSMRRQETRGFTPTRPNVVVPDVDAAKKAGEERFRIAKLQLEGEEEAAKEAAEAWDYWGKYRLAESKVRAEAEMLQQKQVLDFIDEQIAAEEDRMRTAADVVVVDDAMAGASRAVQRYLEEVRAAGLQTEYVVGSAIRGLEDGLTQLFTKGKWDARSFVDMLISEFMRIRIVQPMLASIFGGGTSAGAGSFLALMFGAGGAGAGSAGAAAGAWNSIPMAADGADARAGQPFIIGERGPELFVPRGAGTIVPNGKFGAGGVTVTYAPTINIDSRSDRAQVAQQTAQAVAAGNRQLLEMLRARGAL